jgi:hypothetical protein
MSFTKFAVPPCWSPTSQARTRTYELGVAHALNKSVVIIAQDIEDIPFDYRYLRSIVYDKQGESWEAELSNKITNTLQAQQQVLLKKSMTDGRKMALVGKWIGKLDQKLEDGSVSLETEMEGQTEFSGRNCFAVHDCRAL